VAAQLVQGKGTGTCCVNSSSNLHQPLLLLLLLGGCWGQRGQALLGQHDCRGPPLPADTNIIPTLLLLVKLLCSHAAALLFTPYRTTTHSSSTTTSSSSSSCQGSSCCLSFPACPLLLQQPTNGPKFSQGLQPTEPTQPPCCVINNRLISLITAVLLLQQASL
jgi:hypothetical protein